MNAVLKLRIALIRQFFMVVMFSVLAMQVPAQTVAGPPVSSGPPMWKVKKGENVLWIFGILTPLEADVNWQSQQVESVIAQSQEYIYFKSPEPEIPLNPYKIANGLRLVLKLRNNPDGKTLAEVIPEDLYVRVAQLLARYSIADMEKVRPYFVADAIRGWAIMNNALTEDHGIEIKIENMVKKHKGIKITAIPLGLEAVDYDFLKESADKLISGASLADEIHCLEVSVTSIESDIPEIQARAKAWARGDIGALHENQEYQNALDTCADVYINLDETKDRFEESYQTWVNAAEKALDDNKNTFAVLNVDQLINSDGVLERLRRKGYSIIEP